MLETRKGTLPVVSQERLKVRKDFLTVAALGKKIPRPGLVLQVLENTENDKIRVGFTVTKKVGKAVIRNRVRRRLRAVANEVLQKHTVNCGDFVVIGRLATLVRSYEDLCADFLYALKKAGMLQ